MPDWLIWLIVAGGLALGEMLSLTFILGPVALAACLAAVVAAAGAGTVAQLTVFVIAALASLLLVRPIARKHLRTPVLQRTGTAALIGEGCVVLERVDGHGGRVKLAGEVWSARSYDEDDVYEPGERVTVVEIAGATARVSA
jgi:membrane protein implicated in regulation of membrane protease activity